MMVNMFVVSYHLTSILRACTTVDKVVNGFLSVFSWSDLREWVLAECPEHTIRSSQTNPTNAILKSRYATIICSKKDAGCKWMISVTTDASNKVNTTRDTRKKSF